jgi:hypothetical protein
VGIVGVVAAVDTGDGVVVATTEEVGGGLDVDGAIMDVGEGVIGVVEEDMVGDCNW